MRNLELMSHEELEKLVRSWRWRGIFLSLALLLVTSVAVLCGIMLFNRKVHAVFHAAKADNGHRGWDMGDEAHRKVMIKAFALAGIGVSGRFQVDITDQVLMDDAETVLNLMDRRRAVGLSGNFISLPVETGKVVESRDKIRNWLKEIGDDVKAWEMQVKTQKGIFPFAFVESSKLPLIVVRPLASVLGEPDWIPLEK